MPQVEVLKRSSRAWSAIAGLVDAVLSETQKHQGHCPCQLCEAILPFKTDHAYRRRKGVDGGCAHLHRDRILCALPRSKH